MSYTGAGYVGAKGVASYLKSTAHGGLVQPGSIGGGSGGFMGVVGGGIVTRIAAMIGKPFSIRVGNNPSAQVQSIVQYLEPTLISVHDVKPEYLGIVNSLNDKRIESAQLRINIDNESKSRSIAGKERVKGLSEQVSQIGKEIQRLQNLLIPSAFAQEETLTSTVTTTESMSRVPGRERGEAGAGVVVPVAEQEPQTDIFGNVVTYQPTQTVEGTRGQIRYSDPSINSGLVYNPFSEIGEIVYGTITDVFNIPTEPSFIPTPEPTTEYVPPPEPTTDHVPPPEQIKCPARVQIISNITNVVAGEGEFNCATIEKYEANPDYRIVYLENGFIPTPEPTTEYVPPPEPTTDHVPPPEETRCYMVHGQKLELTQQEVGSYINQGVTVTPCEAITGVTGQVTEVPPDFEYESITTDHVTPPEMPVEPMVTVTPTEPGQVNWIPEPFFSFINNVFRR